MLFCNFYFKYRFREMFTALKMITMTEALKLHFKGPHFAEMIPIVKHSVDTIS